LVTELASWRWFFVAGVLFGALFPLAQQALPSGEVTHGGRLDLPGGLLLGATLAAGLFALTEGADEAGLSTLVLASAGVAALCLAGLVFRQRTTREPFVPRALLANVSYVWLCALTLLLVGANITVNAVLPLPLAAVNGLSASRVGLALLPVALATIAAGRLSARTVDRLGVASPIRWGVVVMVVFLVLLSGPGVGGAAWVASALAAAISVGAVLVKVATTKGVSLAVPQKNLPSAIAINESVWILGVSVGTALFSATAGARSGAAEALNPLHAGTGAAYSDAFLALAVPLLAVLLVSRKLAVR